jgi:dCMP deaminase
MHVSRSTAEITMDFNQYYMSIADVVRQRGNCKGRTVGAVIVRENRIIATGYNGTPEGMTNCTDGGCVRCNNRGEKYEKGTRYDICICVHAEQNALIASARFGHAVEGAVIYSTLQPCFDCSKAALQAKIRGVYYMNTFDAYNTDPELLAQYELIQSQFPDGVRIVQMDQDPNIRLVA